MINLTDPEFQSHRFAVTGRDIDGAACTLIGWRVRDRAQRAVVLTLDSTWRCVVVLTPAQAREVIDGLRRAVEVEGGQ